MRHKVSFCIGDAAAKRAHFAAAGRRSDGLHLDNDEIVCTYKSGDSVFYAFGGIPYGNMSVAEYIAYKKADMNRAPLKTKEVRYFCRLFKLRVPLKRKLKSLSALDYRLVALAASYDVSVKNLYLNLDGLAYSLSRARKLKAMLKTLTRYFLVFVSVSDSRYYKDGYSVTHFNADGNITTVILDGQKIKRVKTKDFYIKHAKESLGVAHLKVKHVVEQCNKTSVTR